MKAKPDNFDISILTPYPGSDIYDHKEKYDIDWDEEKLREIWFSGEAQYGQCAVHTSALTSEEILYYKQALETEFHRGTGGKTSYWGPI